VVFHEWPATGRGCIAGDNQIFGRHASPLRFHLFFHPLFALSVSSVDDSSFPQSFKTVIYLLRFREGAALPQETLSHTPPDRPCVPRPGVVGLDERGGRIKR
jgi:hypothetical protein